MLHHPSSDNGKTVGLFIPGKIFEISSTLSNGAFNNMYLFSDEFLTAFILNNNLSNNCCFSSVNDLFEIKTASLFMTCSTSFKPFITKVLPLLTISKIPSDNPIPGAISTLPPISSIST